MKKPKVAIISDVRTWCWARKSEALRVHLADQFDITIAHLYDKRPDPLPIGCDLYSTFEVFQARQLPRSIPYVTGMTAHVWKTWEHQHGPGTVMRWASRALAFHANSVLLEKEMRGLLKRHIHYVPNGVDEKFFRRMRPRRGGNKLIVGWVGKPNPRKGSDIVEKACSIVSNVELRMVQRTHRNALPPEKMREFYQDLHLLVVQSDMDGTPNPALEAAACGVGIVSNRIGNMPEFIDGQNGVLVERNIHSLADALRTIDVADAIRMGEAARATIERSWTWRHQAPAYGRMWNDALAVRRKVA